MKRLTFALILLAGCSAESCEQECINQVPNPRTYEPCFGTNGARLVVRGGAAICECPGKPVEVRP